MRESLKFPDSFFRFFEQTFYSHIYFSNILQRWSEPCNDLVKATSRIFQRFLYLQSEFVAKVLTNLINFCQQFKSRIENWINEISLLKPEVLSWAANKVDPIADKYGHAAAMINDGFYVILNANDRV